MIDIEEFNSEKVEIVEKKDFEIVNCVAKKNNNDEISFLVRNKLAEKFKEPKYKILVYENIKTDKKKNIILLENKEQMDYLALNLKEFAVLGLFRDKPKANQISKFELNIQKWCNELQRYLENILQFKGIVKIQAAAINGELLTFNIIVSGKGTNNKIVEIAKQISKNMTYKMLNYNNDEIFNILNDYYKS